MKTKKQVSKLVASAAIVLASVAPSYGQNNLGAACGCPPVSARTSVTVTSLSGYSVVPGLTGGELTTGANFTCDKTYILTEKVYVPSGQVLSIAPGTVIKGAPGTASLATALIIERGGKIIASGTQDCPIVFTTTNDNMDNLYPVINRGQWGGLVICGKASNNLLFPANNWTGASGRLAIADGLGVAEGFALNVFQNRFGVNTSVTQTVSGEPNSQTFDDNDNSGILKYVSLRHTGANLQVGNEVNGLSLYSVGRNTRLEHIEIVSCADDNIELFGGTVNMKYITTVYGNDDMFDWDLGWTGKAQFLFGMKGDTQAGWSPDADNGFEADADDQKTNATPRSHPIIYNATLIGNSKSVLNADNSALAAINAKELTEGEIYNSLFANFKHGLNLIKVLGTRAGSSEAYHNWAATGGNGSTSLKIKCNTFTGISVAGLITDVTLTNAGVAALASDNAQFAAEGNTIIATPIAGFSYTFATNPNTNVTTVKPDVVPNPALPLGAGCSVPPVDGFFTNAPYRGAFASTGENWLTDWSYSSVLGAIKNTVVCPTDINEDGVTDVNDFLIFSGSFGSSCN